MSKIVYLFGAGASFGTLPLVKEMPERINNIIEILSGPDLLLSEDKEFEDLTRAPKQSKRKYQQEIINGLKEMKTACENHFSIDTFAKKLWIKKDINGLIKLKVLLSVFFVIEQITHRTNPRYDFFFASLIDSITKLPENIKILSWNYDNQFEKAFSEFSGTTDILKNQSYLNIFKRINQNDLNNYSEAVGFCIFKLNGSTEFYYPGGIRTIPILFNSSTDSVLSEDTLEDIVRTYVDVLYSRETRPIFSFAWEKPDNDNFMSAVINQTWNAEVLVIIGYSFPYFNRSIDRTIISRMKHLEKVYFQSPEANTLIERFTSITTDIPAKNLIPILHTDYFFIPNEL